MIEKFKSIPLSNAGNIPLRSNQLGFGGGEYKKKPFAEKGQKAFQTYCSSMGLLHLYLYSNILDIGVRNMSGVQVPAFLKDFELEVMHISVSIARSL